MHLGTNHAATIDQFLDFQIEVRLNTSGRANRRHAQREIQPRKTRPHVGVHRRRTAHRKEHVIVHAYQTGQHRVALEIDCLCIRFDARSRAGIDRCDLAGANHYRLIFKRVYACAVDYADVCECDYRRFNANELLPLGLRTTLGERNAEHAETQKQRS